MRGLHQPRGWLSRPRRIFPFLGRKPLGVISEGGDEGISQVIDFLADHNQSPDSMIPVMRYWELVAGASQLQRGGSR